MFYDVDCVITGTEFECFFAIDSRNELEQSCFDYMIQLLIEHSHFGGKNSSGFGSFEVVDMPKLNPTIYLEFVEQNKLKIKEYIDNVFLQ
jgi:CRISPR/Cas system CSM-associated protein Csm4 (group 5 of RAMP superfamily)